MAGSLPSSAFSKMSRHMLLQYNKQLRHAGLRAWSWYISSFSQAVVVKCKQQYLSYRHVSGMPNVCSLVQWQCNSFFQEPMLCHTKYTPFAHLPPPSFDTDRSEPLACFTPVLKVIISLQAQTGFSKATAACQGQSRLARQGLTLEPSPLSPLMLWPPS